MDDTSKPDETKQEKKDDEIKEESVEESKQDTEEKIESEEKPENEEESEKKSGEPIPETPVEEPLEEKEKTEEIKDIEPSVEEKPIEAKPEEGKPEKKDAKKKKDDDFKYIVRIANTDINGDKKVVHGLTTIKGVGIHIGTLIADKSGIDRNLKIGDLTDTQIEKIRKTLDDINENTPGWMLNHRKDYETGKDIHLIGSDIDMHLRDEINIMKKIRCYRGIRHERNLRVRGQRTRANNRRGLALGVSKKRET